MFMKNCLLSRLYGTRSSGQTRNSRNQGASLYSYLHYPAMRWYIIAIRKLTHRCKSRCGLSSIVFRLGHCE